MNQEDKDFYMNIWNTREHVSELSGTYLGREPKSTNFHHILPKRDFPEFRHNPENILLVTFEEHTIIERGVKIYEKLKKLEEILTKKYEDKFGNIK